jgi:hypothetical protein
VICVVRSCAWKPCSPPQLFLSLIPRKWKEDVIDFTSRSIFLLASSGKMGGASLIIQNIFDGGRHHSDVDFLSWTDENLVSVWMNGCKNIDA